MPRFLDWKTLGALLALATLGGPSLAQDAAKVQPRAYRVVLENSTVRVLEYISRPGMGVCGAGVHSHPAHLTVALAPQSVRVTQNGKVQTVNLKAGEVFWEEAVTHETENVGPGTTRSLLVEVKAKRP